ncbi:MAG TPA: general secretion pathway protein GspF, partial [Cellvibrionaceae bacterium]|nr:general secretion pathway protein GspF [Cellvibrionaceae bacterium]
MKSKAPIGLNQPLKLADHPKPRTRRELISQGFQMGVGTLLGGSALSLLGASPAHAQLSADLLDALKTKGCGVNANASGSIPFICFDLAGGANIAGSNVLVGGRGGQLDFLSTAGYRKLGLPGDQLPGQTNAANLTTGFFYDNSLGLAFHSDSALLKGIKKRSTMATWSNTDGCAIAARSENDTGNNPHNPMYGINRAGANGSLLALVGSRASDSGGNSMAPAMMINNA